MIAGNPNSCRTLVIASIVLAALMLIGAALFATRKKTDPQKEPPMVPTALLTNNELNSLELA